MIKTINRTIFRRMLEKARRREEDDDHLSDKERIQIVKLYKKFNPSFKRTKDWNEDFVNIVFDEI